MDANSGGEKFPFWPWLPLEKVHFIRAHGFAIAEEGDYDSEAYGGLGRRVCNDEEGKNLALNIAEDPGESDEINVNGVENELDRHENDDDVTARNDADGADEEERKT